MMNDVLVQCRGGPDPETLDLDHVVARIRLFCRRARLTFHDTDDVVQDCLVEALETGGIDWRSVFRRIDRTRRAIARDRKRRVSLSSVEGQLIDYETPDRLAEVFEAVDDLYNTVCTRSLVSLRHFNDWKLVQVLLERGSPELSACIQSRYLHERGKLPSPATFRRIQTKIFRKLDRLAQEICVRKGLIPADSARMEWRDK